MKRETHPRSAVKAITWRMIASLTTMALVYIFTGQILLTIGIGVFEILSKLLFYYLHERAWSRIAWGKLKHPLDDFDIKRDLSSEDREKIMKQLRDLGYMD